MTCCPKDSKMKFWLKSIQEMSGQEIVDDIHLVNGFRWNKAPRSLIYYNIQVTLQIITFPIILFNRTFITIVLYSKLKVIVSLK